MTKTSITFLFILYILIAACTPEVPSDSEGTRLLSENSIKNLYINPEFTVLAMRQDDKAAVTIAIKSANTKDYVISDQKYILDRNVEDLSRLSSFAVRTKSGYSVSVALEGSKNSSFYHLSFSPEGHLLDNVKTDDSKVNYTGMSTVMYNGSFLRSNIVNGKIIIEQLRQNKWGSLYETDIEASVTGLAVHDNKLYLAVLHNSIASEYVLENTGFIKSISTKTQKTPVVDIAGIYPAANSIIIYSDSSDADISEYTYSADTDSFLAEFVYLKNKDNMYYHGNGWFIKNSTDIGLNNFPIRKTGISEPNIVKKPDGSFFFIYEGIEKGRVWKTGALASEDGISFRDTAISLINDYQDINTSESSFYEAGLEYHKDTYYLACAELLMKNNRRLPEQLVLYLSDNGSHFHKADIPPITLQDLYEKTGKPHDRIGEPSLLFRDGVLKMWFIGREKEPRRRVIYYAELKKDHWDIYEKPVLFPTEEWESYHTGCPDVTFTEGRYYMLYRGDIGYKGIGEAVSEDGINWQKSTRNPVIPNNSRKWKYGLLSSAMVGEPAILLDHDRIRLWAGIRTTGIKWEIYYFEKPKLF